MLNPYSGGCAMRLLLVFAFLVGWSEALLACTGCGCRGGPGYRGPDGHCVGWAQLNSRCGNPPTTRCTYEGTSGPGVGSPPPSPPVGPLSNVHTTRAGGLGCRDMLTIHKLSTCVPGQTRDCEREKTAHIDAGTCALIPVGVTVTIEASSHTFDWLRIRVPGHPAPLWTDRRLVLER
jgi:hypothetical protein